MVGIYLMPIGDCKKQIKVYLNIKYHKKYLDYIADHLLCKSQAGRLIFQAHFGTKEDRVVIDRIIYILEVKKQSDPSASMSDVCKQIIKKFLDQAKFKAILSK